MANMMKPLYPDFSAGELSPKLAGRVDLPIVSRGAKEMLNFKPDPLGGAYKRGGLETLAQLLGAAKVITWNVNDDVDLLVVVYDGYIRVMAMRADGSIVPVIGPDSNPVSITYLDGAAAKYATYSIADAPKIKYAQCLRELTLVCAGKYPAFYMKLEDLSADMTTASISYGVYEYTGNVASNPGINLGDETKPVTGAVILDVFSQLAANIWHTVDSSSYIIVNNVQKQITQIRKTGQVYPRSYDLYYNGEAAEFKVLDGPTAVGHALAFGRYSKWAVVPPTRHVIDPVDFTCTASTTRTQLLDSMQSYYIEGQFIFLGDQDGNRVLDVGKAYFHPRRDTSKLEVTYLEGATPTTITVLPDQATYKLSITMASLGYSVNGGVISAATIVSYTTPWMEKNRQYPCDPGLLLNGQKVGWAMRDDTAGQPSLTVLLTGETVPRRITRDSSGLIGRVGVILTPFYLGNEYPTAVAYHQGRLVLAAGNVVYMSKVNDFSNFCYFEEIQFTKTSLKPASEWAAPTVPETRTETSFSQQIGASSAIKLVLATDENETVQWMISAGDLVIGTSTTEWVFPAAADAVKSKVVMTSRNGSADIHARFAMGAVMVTSRTRKSVKAYTPGAAEESPDIMRFAEHVAKGVIKGFDFRQDPREELYFVLEDGTALVATRSADGVAFAPITTSAGATIEDVFVVAASDEDAVCFIVKRGLNYYIERLLSTDDKTFATRCHLDAAARVTVAGNALSGLTRFADQVVHLSIMTGTEGEVGGVGTVGPGGALSTFTRYGAAAAEPLPNGSAVVGFPFTARLTFSRIDGADTEGIPKSGGPIHMRVYNSGPFELKHRGESYAVPMPLDEAGLVQYPYSGPVRFENPAGESVDQTITFESTDARAVNILLAAPTFSVGDGV